MPSRTETAIYMLKTLVVRLRKEAGLSRGTLIEDLESIIAFLQRGEEKAKIDRRKS